VKIRNPLLTRLVARCVLGVLRLLFWTVRIKRRSAVPEANMFENPSPQRFLYSVWHDGILVALLAGRHRHMAALVSRHQDGSYLSDALQMVNVSTIRGSSSRGGAQAVRQLMNSANDKHVTITSDGPRGPRRQTKQGIIYLASKTGRPIVPVAMSCDRAWRIPGSWTDMLLPKPFSNVYILGGEPVEVPDDLDRDGIRHHVARLQEAMDRVNDESERLATGRDQPIPQRPRKAAA